jgi:hypothetical protein
LINDNNINQPYYLRDLDYSNTLEHYLYICIIVIQAKQGNKTMEEIKKELRELLEVTELIKAYTSKDEYTEIRNKLISNFEKTLVDNYIHNVKVLISRETRE